MVAKVEGQPSVDQVTENTGDRGNSNKSWGSSVLKKGIKWTVGGCCALMGTGAAVTHGSALVQSAVSWYFGGGILANAMGYVAAGAATPYLTTAGCLVGGVAGASLVLASAAVAPYVVDGVNALYDKCAELGTKILSRAEAV